MEEETQLLGCLFHDADFSRLGRKPAFLFSWAGIFVSFSTGPVYMYFFRDISPYWLLPGSVLQIFGGGVPVAMSVLYAMAADVTSEKDRCVSYTPAELATLIRR
jgi:MFS transporter, PCFT/HCP family, solute carrier family 46 (folate transporter), member 1